MYWGASICSPEDAKDGFDISEGRVRALRRMLAAYLHVESCDYTRSRGISVPGGFEVGGDLELGEASMYLASLAQTVVELLSAQLDAMAAAKALAEKPKPVVPVHRPQPKPATLVG
jgi:hypothetical protein